MAIEKTTKYKVFKKYKSSDNVSWILVEPDESEYMAWEKNSIDCGYIPPINPDTTGSTTGDTGTTTGETTCKTKVTYENGSTKEFVTNCEITSGDIENHTEVTKVEIGTCVTSIGERAFWNFSSLTAVTIPDSVTNIGASAFTYCSSLTAVTIPDSVASIGSHTFYGCSNLKSINIPDSVTSIEGKTFNGCESLTGITIPNSVTSIGDGAFWDCRSLASLIIPDSVKGIGDAAFSSCVNLSSVTFGSRVKSIGEYAFISCSSLSSVTFGSGVTFICSNAFLRCSGLTSITFKGTASQWKNIKKFDSWDSEVPAKVVHCTDGDVKLESYYTFISVSSTLPGDYYGVNGTLEKSSIKQIIYAKTVDIGTGVTSIGDSCFENCQDLISINISSTVRMLDDECFRKTPKLKNVTISSSVIEIRNYVFQDSAVTSLTFEGSTSQWNAIAKGYEWQGNVKFIHCSDGDVTL